MNLFCLHRITLPALMLMILSCFPVLFTRNLFAMGDGSKFVFAQLKYRGGNWNPRQDSAKRLVWELIKQTNIEAKLMTIIVTPDSKDIFEYPFIYMAGDREFEPFTENERENLRRFLEFGGTMLIDDSLGKQDIGFDKSARRELNRLFPDYTMDKLSDDHTIFRSFFLIKNSAGRIIEKPYLEGLTIDDRTVIIFSQNDLGGAWARDNLGNWEYETAPGGEEQRKKAFRLGINIVMYALTGNYKQDQVHLPFILKRQK